MVDKISEKRIKSIIQYTKIIEIFDKFSERLVTMVLHIPNICVALLILMIMVLLGKTNTSSLTGDFALLAKKFNDNILTIFSVVTAISALLANIAWNFAKLPGINDTIDNKYLDENTSRDLKYNEKLFVDASRWFVVSIFLLIPSIFILYLLTSNQTSLQVIEVVKTIVYTTLVGAQFAIILGINRIIAYFSEYISYYFSKSHIGFELYKDLVVHHVRERYQILTWSIIYLTTLVLFVNSIISFFIADYLNIYFSIMFLASITSLARTYVLGARSISWLIYIVFLLSMYIFSERVVDLIQKIV